MDFIKKGTLTTKYVADGSEFKKKGDGYVLKSTKNPKYERFIGETLNESAWDLISQSDCTDGPEHDRAYTILIAKIRTGEQAFTGKSNILLKKNEKILFTAPNISFSEPRAVRVTDSAFIGGSHRTGKHSRVGIGTGKSISRSTDVMTHIDDGTVTITNKRFVFSGSKKTINVDLKKITSIDIYSNGIKLERSNKQKVEQFIGFEELAFNFRLDGKKYFIKFDGLIIKTLIEAGLNYDENKKLEAQTKPKLKPKIETKTEVKPKIETKKHVETKPKAEVKPKNITTTNKDNVDDLLKYADLYEKGLLTKEEFEFKKAQILGMNEDISNSESFESRKLDLALTCPNCGNEVDVDSKFCSNCGFNLEE